MTQRRSRKSTTERARFLFRVQESAAGAPFWIMPEAWDRELSGLGDGFLGFELPEATTFERANEIADFLNDNIESISYTRLYEVP